MTIKQLIQQLRQLDQNMEVVISSDTELNQIFSNFDLEMIEMDDLMDTSEKVIIYPVGRPEEE